MDWDFEILHLNVLTCSEEYGILVGVSSSLCSIVGGEYCVTGELHRALPRTFPEVLNVVLS